MGFVIRRGTRDKPKYYARYVDIDGGEKTRRIKAARTKEQAERFLHEIETRLIEGRLGLEPKAPATQVVPLMDQWIETLTNRNAPDDRSRFKRHVRPAFEGKSLATALELGTIMTWIDDQRRARQPGPDGKVDGLSEASIRHNLNLVSRFFSWAISHGHATVNPVRIIPTGKRPQESQRRDAPWLRDDSIVPTLMNTLPEPINLMFYLGNRSGLRTGEIAGLRMADLEYLKDGLVRARYSYGTFLKEDKHCTGKIKWPPAAPDAEQFLRPWTERRKAQGAGPEDLVFPAPPSKQNPRRLPWRGYRKEQVEAIWEEAAKKCGVEMTWYQATRHTFVTRLLEAGITLDEVSEAVGHSSPVVTKRYYDHHVRKGYSAAMAAALRQPETKKAHKT
jgi:integrase